MKACVVCNFRGCWMLFSFEVELFTESAARWAEVSKLLSVLLSASYSASGLLQLSSIWLFLWALGPCSGLHACEVCAPNHWVSLQILSSFMVFIFCQILKSHDLLYGQNPRNLHVLWSPLSWSLFMTFSSFLDIPYMQFYFWWSPIFHIFVFWLMPSVSSVKTFACLRLWKSPMFFPGSFDGLAFIFFFMTHLKSLSGYALKWYHL